MRTWCAAGSAAHRFGILTAVRAVAQSAVCTAIEAAFRAKVYAVFGVMALIFASAMAQADTATASSKFDRHLDIEMSAADRRHLLARTGFGVPGADFLALEGLSRREAVDHIISRLHTVPTYAMPQWTEASVPHYHAKADMDAMQRMLFDQRRDAELGSLRQWWVREMLEGTSAATERLVLLWHDLVPVDYQAINRGSLALARQNALFRRSHQGSWAQLLKALLKDAALLSYLDNSKNRKNAPNENLGREFLELFTLGVGNYSEYDVREAARALTGHTFSTVANLVFYVHSGHHDPSDKTLFGQTGPHDAEALVDIVLQQPEAALHLARVYWHAFVSDAEPDPTALDLIADAFRASEHDLGVLYRTVLESESFWAAEHRGGLIKSPVDLVTGLARTLEYPKRSHRHFAALQGALGLAFFDPPNVAGWDDGDAWVTPARLIARLEATTELSFGDVTAGKRGAADMSGSADMSGMSMPSMNDEATKPSSSESSTLKLRIASEAYQGPAEILVSTLTDGTPTWQSPVITLRRGHDTEKYGRPASRADLSWESLSLAVPSLLAESADAVSVEFLNDASGPGGDRNVYIDQIQFGYRATHAANGIQRSGCPPDGEAQAGNLYCKGVVTVPLSTHPPTSLSGAVTEGRDVDVPAVARASAVRLRWLNYNRANESVGATLMLEHVHLSGMHAELLQFHVGDNKNKGPHLRIESLSCRPDCFDAWPECAWVDRRDTSNVRLTLPIDPAVRAQDVCFNESLDPADRGWLELLLDNAPALLRSLKDSPVAQRDPEAFRELVRRVSAVAPPGDTDSDTSTITFDAVWAPPLSLIEDPPALVPAVEGLDALFAEFEVSGVDPVSLLWPGIEVDLPVFSGSDAQRLEAALAHPAFQLR